MVRGPWSVARGPWRVVRQMQRACILARPSLAYIGLFPLLSGKLSGASLRRDMLLWNCGIMEMSHYGIVALELDVRC